MRSLLVLLGLLVLLLAIGCGGGGGAVPLPDPDPDPDPDPTGSARTQEVIQDCAPDLLLKAQDLARLFDAILHGAGAAQGAQLSSDGQGGYLADGPPDGEFANLLFEHDPSGTGLISGLGQLGFEDGAGSDVAVLDETQMDQLRSTGIDALGAIRPTLPDGTDVRATYNGVGDETAILNVAIAMQGGEPAATTGTLDMLPPGCVVRLTLDGVAFAGLITPHPSGVFQFSLSAGADTVTGTITTDGTSVASVVASLNGGANTNWSLNLDTGVATQL